MECSVHSSHSGWSHEVAKRLNNKALKTNDLKEDNEGLF